MQVLAIDQVGEVSSALTWTMDNIAQYGGDPNRVFIMGHSSGELRPFFYLQFFAVVVTKLQNYHI